MFNGRYSLFKVVSCLLLFFLLATFGWAWIFLEANPSEIVGGLFAQVASSVGMSVNVSSNPYNTLAQQLREKEVQLQQKENDVAAKERTLKQRELFSNGWNGIILILIFGFLILLLGLILINFYLDRKRKEKEKGIQ